MCGFVGVLDNRDGITEAEQHFSAVLKKIRHRGPDDQGIFKTEWLALAHARLAIIDLTESGHQPMMDKSGRYVIVFNGEIYNFKELHQKHCSNGNDRPATSDTAVLLEMYAQYGSDCLKYLNGMFAFAIADLKQQIVLLARDRFGEKPLYWTKHGKKVAFSSELKALKALSPSFASTLDPESVFLFHTIGSIPSPKTIYSDVQALRPGHYIEITANGDFSEKAYWELSQALVDYTPSPHSTSEIIEETQSRLLNAVSSRMISDVPVGLFLSGGYDSGAITALLTALRLPIKSALCVDFEDRKFSEFDLAQVTAREFNIDLHRHVISPQTFTNSISGFFNAMDQPTCDGYNTYFVSQAAKELGIKVWLSGVGGDELFGGYPFFTRISKLKWLSRALSLTLPRSMVNFAAPHLVERLRLSRVLHLADQGDPNVRAYQVNRNCIPWRNAYHMLSCSLRRNFLPDVGSHTDRFYPSTSYASDDFQKATILESTIFMGSQLLRDMDNFSMSHSIELRAPFLDHDLFQYVSRLSNQFKECPGRIKPLLINALPYPLPTIIQKQRKRGFTFPIEAWLRSELRGSFEHYAFDKTNSLFWDLPIIKRMWKAYLCGKVHWGVIWNIYVFARWVKDHNEHL
jgi:asparagine synthase (glutamine-hydrolysing)